MSKRDDVKPLYSNSKRLERCCKYLFGINCIISLASILFLGSIKEALAIIQIVDAFLFVVIGCIDDGIFWYNAESSRRKNSIQSAFNVQLSELETDGYYNNRIGPCISKYAVNIFESNYFSKFIAGKMLIKSAGKALLSIVVLIISCRVISNSDMLLVITQSVFSAYIIEDTIMLALYKVKMDQIYNEAFLEFITIGIKEKKQEIWLLSYAVEYESIKAHFKVRLDSKIFDTYNNYLSQKWAEIQKKIYISKKISNP